MDWKVLFLTPWLGWSEAFILTICSVLLMVRERFCKTPGRIHWFLKFSLPVAAALFSIRFIVCTISGRTEIWDAHPGVFAATGMLIMYVFSAGEIETVGYRLVPLIGYFVFSTLTSLLILVGR